MDRSSVIIPGFIILILVSACFAGCSDSSSSGSSAATTPVATTLATKYVAGDIVKNPKSSSGTALLIIGYDTATDMYERAYVYPGTDGTWYRMDTKTDKIRRDQLEKVYTSKVKTVTVSAVPVRTPTPEPTVAEIYTPRTTSTTTAVTTTTTVAQAPRITDISPDKGTAGTTVSITNLAGQNFLSGANVSLKKSGETSIIASDVSVVSVNQITGKFTIPSDAVPGYWDLIVTNPGGLSHTFQNGFLIKEGSGTTTTTTTTTTTGSTTATISSVWMTSSISGSVGGYMELNIQGTNLAPSVTKIRLTRDGATTIESTSYFASSTTSSRATFNVPPGSSGTWSITAVDSNSNNIGTLSNALTI